MSDEQDSETDAQGPSDMFPVVWVKMEVDEDGIVTGIDNEEGGENIEGDCQNPETTEDTDDSAPNKQRQLRSKRKHQPRTHHLQCDYCEYRTSFKNALKFHMLKHTNPEPYSCEHCDYTTLYPCSLRRHLMGQHNVKEKDTDETPSFNCSECDYTTMFKGNLAAHKRKHATEKRFKCDQCSFSSAYRNSYKKHSKMHKVKNSTTLYQCDQCSFSTRYEGHIARHLAQIHKIISTKAHKCDQCQFSTTIKWRLSIHKNRSRRVEPIKCQYCDYETQYNCSYKLHKIKHLNRKSKVVETDIYVPNEDYVPHSEEMSEKIDELVSKNNLEEFPTPNLLTTLLEKNNDALVPAMTGKTEYLLDIESDAIDWRSIKVIENLGNEKPFRCTGCSYMSKFKASVQRHFQRLHTSENSKPYKCMHCDFSTKTKDQISLHNKRSKSDVPLTCKLCEFTTNLKCQNVMHQKVHYPFKCKLCSYTCRINSDIQRHYSTVHLGNGLKCQYCDHRAARKDSLLCHEAIHTGVKPFQCQFCDYSTVRRCVLDTHVRKIHPENYAVTIIDYSKIQSLKIEKDEVHKTEDIAEINPLFQSELIRNAIDLSQMDVSGTQGTFQNKPQDSNFEKRHGEDKSKSDCPEAIFGSKYQEDHFRSSSQESNGQECIKRKLDKRDPDPELENHFEMETTVEVVSI